MKTHRLKIWSHWYAEVSAGRMQFQIRSEQDRVFQAGDQLELQSWDQGRGQYVQGAAPIFAEVLGVYHLPGLQAGYVALSIKVGRLEGAS